MEFTRTKDSKPNRMKRTRFSNIQLTLEDKCVVCWERPRHAKSCHQCSATVCNACFFELMEIYDITNCPNCRVGIDEENMLETWQLRYVKKKTIEQLETLTKEINSLKIEKEHLQLKERLQFKHTTLQLHVHRWVKQYVTQNNLENKEFERELKELETDDEITKKTAPLECNRHEEGETAEQKKNISCI